MQVPDQLVCGGIRPGGRISQITVHFLKAAQATPCVDASLQEARMIRARNEQQNEETVERAVLEEDLHSIFFLFVLRLRIGVSQE